jgi:hypothetical protein
MVFTEILYQFRKDRVCDAREMRRCVRGVPAETPVLVDKSDVVTRALEQVRGGDAGDSCSDDQHVHRNVVF